MTLLTQMKQDYMAERHSLIAKQAALKHLSEQILNALEITGESEREKLVRANEQVQHALANVEDLLDDCYNDLP